MSLEYFQKCRNALTAVSSKEFGLAVSFVEDAKKILDASTWPVELKKSRLRYLETLDSFVKSSGSLLQGKTLVRADVPSTTPIRTAKITDPGMLPAGDVGTPELMKRIARLEQANAALAERLKKTPSIDPMCVTDPTFAWPHSELEEFGIVVFGHTRVDEIGDVLESLRRQDALQHVEVRLDGDQGKRELQLRVEETIARVKQYPVKKLHTQRGNFGFRKMILLGLLDMCRKYRDILVLEDDCFPTRDAVEIFREELDVIRNNPRIFSVYGHHFLTDSERETCSRFQGWGWATTSEKLRPILRQLIDLYSMPEESYLRFVKLMFSPQIKQRIDVTPPRQPSYTIEKFFAWDETLGMLTALNNQVHKPTRKRVIFNCGLGKGSTHFDDDRYRAVPYNLIAPEEVWHYF